MDTTLSCDRCGSPEHLYQLLGTSAGLCAGCFGRTHVAVPHPAGCLQRLRHPRRPGPGAMRRHRSC